VIGRKPLTLICSAVCRGNLSIDRHLIQERLAQPLIVNADSFLLKQAIGCGQNLFSQWVVVRAQNLIADEINLPSILPTPSRAVP
jgi:hypothetical protein